MQALTERTRTRRTTPARECLALMVRLEPPAALRLRRRARAERVALGALAERWLMERLMKEARDEQPLY